MPIKTITKEHQKNKRSGKSQPTLILDCQCFHAFHVLGLCIGKVMQTWNLILFLSISRKILCKGLQCWKSPLDGDQCLEWSDTIFPVGFCRIFMPKINYVHDVNLNKNVCYDREYKIHVFTSRKWINKLFWVFILVLLMYLRVAVTFRNLSPGIAPGRVTGLAGSAWSPIKQENWHCQKKEPKMRSEVLMSGP